MKSALLSCGSALLTYLAVSGGPALAEDPRPLSAAAGGSGVGRIVPTEPVGASAAAVLPLEFVRVHAAAAAVPDLPLDQGRYVPMPLARDLSGWGQRRLVFNEAQARFELPVDVALRRGHVRCTLIAADADSVAPLVGWFRGQGYHTQDQLEERQGLLRLARVLAIVVGLFALGGVLNGAITVLITTMMNVKSKTFEIGILRAYGFRHRDVLGIFLSQALAVGVGAFSLAAAAVWVLEPYLRHLLCQAFWLEADAFLIRSPFAAALWWLPAIGLLVAVGFSLLGVLVPAVWSCRLAPVEALRHGE